MSLLKLNRERPAHKPRTKQDIVNYLHNHRRHFTMHRINGASSYSRTIKLHAIRFPDKPTESVAWDIIAAEHGPHEAWRDWNQLKRVFGVRHKDHWAIVQNGRSGGHLVLTHAEQHVTGYKSQCQECGQLNFCRVLPPEPDTEEGNLRTSARRIISHAGKHKFLADLEFNQHHWPKERREALAKEVKTDITANGRFTGNQCGRCHAEGALEDIPYTHTELRVWLGESVDQGEDFEAWGLSDLQDRRDLVWDFDTTVERMIGSFVHFCQTHTVEEQEIIVPTTRTVLRATLREEAA